MTLRAPPSAGRRAGGLGRIYECPPRGWLPCSEWILEKEPQTLWVGERCLPGPEPFPVYATRPY